MPDSEVQGTSSRRTNAWFSTTHWSVISRARDADTQCAHEALEKLGHTYWPPLYAFIRREGYNAEDAKDLTQEFLTRLIHREWLTHLQHQDGKFRSFLLTFLKHFLSDERDRARAQKRGGGKPIVSIDEYDAEERASIGPVNGLTPEQIYERHWARAVMTEATQRLRNEYASKGNVALFDAIADLEPGKHGKKSYAQIAAELGKSEQAIKNAVITFRRRYSELMREEIAQTVTDAAQLDDEIRHLMNVFSG